MNNYLNEFFIKFGFEKSDAEYLISAYENICKNSETKKLWHNAIKCYEADINYNFNELLASANLAGEMVNIHKYTAELLFSICLTKHLENVYKQKGIADEIYFNTVLDLRYKLEECKAVKGVVGSFVAYWFEGMFNLQRFALGRLQFQIYNNECDYQIGDFKVTPNIKALAVHIPKTGTSMDEKSCDASFEMAKEFFKDQFDDRFVFTCSSWLLFPEHDKLLNKNSNIIKFKNRFTIVDCGYYEENKELWRIFNTDETNPDLLSASTSLQKIYLNHIKKGGKTGWGFGFYIV